ncbi:hypothetical protein NONO_c16000 [Nocardia nova SH22a]|uniref:Uncharacterized protein n=1 Tax=Nocardia nova SH22a TaxID=1415166 RepID=W5TGQ1_9NOCA|nr:hypothetical protein [Nocardia nova]AHH16401.1 hypothetical protein NONO_c16000 [Nocardia nova SH22a]
MAKIHPMLIPDMTADGYDHRYDYYKKAGEFALDTLKFLDRIYRSCGEKSKVEPPTVKQAPQLPASSSGLKSSGDASQTIKNYAVVAQTLNQTILDMQETDKHLAPIAKKTAEISSQAMDECDKIVDAVNKQAPTVPDDGISETEYILTYMKKAFDDGEKALKKAKDGNGESASKVKELTEQHKKDEERIKQLEQKVKDLEAGKNPSDPSQTGSPYDPTPITPTNTDTDPTGLGDLGLGDLGIDDPADTDPSDPTGLGNSLGDDTSTGGDSGSDSSGLGDGYGTTPDGTTPAAAATPASMTSPTSGMGSGMGGMGDMMSQMLPMLAQQQMMRQMQDQDMAGRRNQLRSAYPQQPLTSAQPVNANPQPANATPAEAHSGPPQGSSSSQQGHPDGAAPAARTPDADGMVEYPFPDGRTQRVPVVVAQALDAAFGNKSGTDAKKAYEKTPVTWSGPKQIGEHVGPEDDEKMTTGVVGVWEKVEAVVAKFGTAADGGTIEAIIDGELHVLDGDNMDTLSGKAGEFGPFSDFQRPAGIDATAPDASGDSSPGTPIPGDQSGGVLSAAVGTPT